jgi:uncharacterized protein
MARPATTRVSFLVAGMVGAAAGAMSGLFGVGGGILIVPGLVILGGMPQRKAHATSLAAIVPIAVAGASGYAMEGAVNWLAAGLLTVGAAAGIVAGTRALRRLPDRTLRLVFAAFLLLAAALLPVEVTSVAETAIDVGVGVQLVAVGVLAGALAGLLGVGGGILMIPALVLLASVPQAVAKGTSLAVIVPTALVGTIQNMRRGDADLPVAAVAGGAGVLFAFLASLVSVRMDPVLSAILFGLLLVAMAVRLLLSAGGRPVPGDRRPVSSPVSPRSARRATGRTTSRGRRPTSG